MQIPCLGGYSCGYYSLSYPLSLKNLGNWIDRHNISQTIQDKLRSHSILSFEDLKALTDTDILEFGLNIGDRNRLKTALTKLKE